MLRRKIMLLGILGISLIFSIIYFLPNVHAINYTISDEEDDVLQDCPTGEETGDYHDEIDIIELTVAGQYINFTVAGSFFDWDSSYFGTVIFSQSFESDASNHLTWSPPYYAIDWQNKSGPIEVTLEKGYHLGGNNFAYEVWNGTGWEDRNTATPFNILSDITEHSLISYIPDGVEDIPSNMKVVGNTKFFDFDGCDYSDLTPIPSSDTDSSDNGIPSYNLYIFICTMIGVSIIFLRKYRSRKI